MEVVTNDIALMSWNKAEITISKLLTHVLETVLLQIRRLLWASPVGPFGTSPELRKMLRISNSSWPGDTLPRLAIHHHKQQQNTLSRVNAVL